METRSIRVGAKMAIVLSVVIVLMTLVGVTGYRGCSSIAGTTVALLEKDMRIFEGFATARSIALELRRYEKNMFIRIGSTDERAKKDFPKWEEQLNLLQGKVSELEKLVGKEKDKEAVSKIRDGLKTYSDGFRSVHSRIQSGDLKQAAEADAALGSARDVMNGVNKTAEESVDRWVKAMQQEKSLVLSGSRRTGMMIILFSLLAVACGAVASFFLYRSITVPLRNIMGIMSLMAEGDITKRVEVSSRDEFGEMAASYNDFSGKLGEIVKNIGKGIIELLSVAGQAHQSSVQMATGAEQVAAQAQTVATASEEMAATSAEIAQNCNMAAQSSENANRSAIAGAEVVHATVEGMARIADRVRESARTVESLGQRSDQIGEIIGTIEDIADQTNLLALNAAIEAARAGEQGRGFAVVADEVRALAERTTKATKEISEMIKTIQQETRGAVASMEDGVREVENGTHEASKSGEALQDILNLIGEVTMQVNQIATAAEQQTATTGEISSNIQEITQVVLLSAKGAQDMARAAEEQTKVTEELQSLVKFFRT